MCRHLRATSAHHGQACPAGYLLHSLTDALQFGEAGSTENSVTDFYLSDMDSAHRHKGEVNINLPGSDPGFEHYS